MKIQVPLVIEMTDQQVDDYASEFDIPFANRGKPYTADVVTSVRKLILSRAKQAMHVSGSGAEVILK